MFKRLFVLLAALTASSAFAQPRYMGNYDFQNLGVDAYDFAVVLGGVTTVTSTWQSLYKGQSFPAPGIVQVGSDMLIHWTNPSAGVIKAGSVFHVGWTTVGPYTIKDMYFTDQFGQRIRCSRVLIVTAHFSTTNIVAFDNPLDVAVTLRAPQFMIASKPWTLDVLNPDNQTLMQQLRPLGGDVVIPPGGEVMMQIPAQVPPGAGVVVVYGAPGDGGDAAVQAFVQYIGG